MIKDIQILAYNVAGLISIPVNIPDQQTCEPSLYDKVRNEIKRIQSLPNDAIVDTDFFQGIIQRKSRTEYLEELQDELSRLPNDHELIIRDEILQKAHT